MILQYQKPPKPLRKTRLKRRTPLHGLKRNPKTAGRRQRMTNLGHPRIKQIPLPKLKKKLWKLLHDFVLVRDNGICVSCGKAGNQCGHYIKKSICNLMWQYRVENLGCQCVRCNVFLNGNPVEYRKWMIKQYGEDYVKWLEDVYHEKLPMSFNPREYIEGLIRSLTLPSI